MLPNANAEDFGPFDAFAPLAQLSELDPLAPTLPAPTWISDIPESVYPRDGTIVMVQGTFAAQPQPLEQPQQVQTTPTPVPPTGAFGGVRPDALSPELLERRLQDINPSASESLSPYTARTTGQTDLGDILRSSNTVRTVETQRRSSISFDPIIRGYRQGQIYTNSDGQNYIPARQDLDTAISKIDPGRIQNVNVVAGPYGLRYGPGFGFIDITTLPTARSNGNGYVTEYRDTFNVISNGGQVYNREVASIGAENWGLRVGSGQRKGSDYVAGNGQHIPGSYSSTDTNIDFGYSFSEYQRMEVSYMRYDQGYTQYPARFFDLNFLKTDSVNLRYTGQDPTKPWTMASGQIWFNNTQFGGNNANKYLPYYPEGQYAVQAIDLQQGVALPAPTAANPAPSIGNISASTSGQTSNTGARTGLTFGELDERHVNVGSDFRFIDQAITENYSFSAPVTPIAPFSTNQPRSYFTDPGIYTEFVRPGAIWTSSAGFRVDYTTSRAFGDQITNGSLAPPGTNLSASNQLFAGYWNNTLNITQELTANGGVGYAERAPTLTERYADGIFLQSLQSGYTRVIGDPTLNKERNIQVDVGFKADYGSFRARGNAYYAFISNYITFYGSGVAIPPYPSAVLVHYMNTPLATLAGFDWNMEYDLNSRWTAFANEYYIRGEDMSIHAPLPLIPPLMSVLGLRLHDSNGGQRWGVEGFVRIADAQSRLAAIRGTATSTTPDLLVEQPTQGWTTLNIRGYYNWSRNVSITGGINNLTNTFYVQSIDPRVVSPLNGTTTALYSPGISPYMGFDCRF